MDNWKRNAAAAALIVPFALGCVSTPVSAPADGQVLISANPTTIVLDEFATPAVTTGSARVTVQVLDKNGIPQSNVQVFIDATGGELASAALPDPELETDDNGRVTDTLNVSLGDPAAIEVTARSGSLSATVGVVVNEVGPNQAPVPTIDITPANSSLAGGTVIFDGSFSADPDGDAITCYQWQFDTTVAIANPVLACPPPFASSRCEVEQGPDLRLLTRTYDDPQSVTVTLRISDDPSIACTTGPTALPKSSFNGITAAVYTILCAAPTAAAGPDQSNVPLGGGSVSVSLSAAGSTPLADIVSYEWDCKNGDAPISGQSVMCTYTAIGTYNVTLTVTNDCGRTDLDVVRITVI
jgi:hypothetical protein